MNGLEAMVEFVRDEIVQPNVGKKWVGTWAPLILTLFFFILGANAIGLIPVFDVIGLRRSLRAADGRAFVHQTGASRRHDRDGDFNVTAALATVTFGAIILAGSLAHGFVKHWVNLVPHGLAWPIYILLIPIEVMGMFARRSR